MFPNFVNEHKLKNRHKKNDFYDVGQIYPKTSGHFPAV